MFMPGDMLTQNLTDPLRDTSPAMLQDVLCSFALARAAHLSQERRNTHFFLSRDNPTLLFINGLTDYSCSFYCCATY